MVPFSLFTLLIGQHKQQHRHGALRLLHRVGSEADLVVAID
jgi:hypothetical protein